MFSDFFSFKTKITRELNKITEHHSHKSYSFCKNFIKKLNKLTPFFENDILRAYEHDSRLIIYFTDDEIAKILYAKQDVAQIFSNSFVISVEKHSRVYFTIHDSRRLHIGSTLARYDDIYSKINEFCNSISCNGFNVYVDYHKLFNLVCDKKFHLSLCLWFAMTKTETILAQDQLKDIINGILRDLNVRYDYSYVYNNFRHSIELSGWLSRGIYASCFDTTDHVKFPRSLRINLLKYLSNPDYFKDAINFFRDTYNEDILTNYDYVIVDNELFKRNIQNSIDVGTFKYHFTYDGSTILQDTTCNSAKLEDAYKALKSLLTSNVYIIFNPHTQERYVLFTEKKDFISLKSYFESNISDKYDCSRLIERLIDRFSDFKVSEKVLLSNPEALLDCFSISKTGCHIYFDNLHNLAMEKNENTIVFNPYLTIMMVIKMFIDKNLLSTDELIKFSFYKRFPFKFVKSLEEYLSSNILPCDIAKEDFPTLSGYYAGHVEFLDNISESSSSVLKIAFFDKITPNDKINKLLNARQTVLQKNSPTINGEKPIELDSLLQQYDSPVILSTQSINDFCQNSSNTLYANTLIISKEYTEGDCYKVIGIIVNRPHLYNVFDLIKAKAINTKAIYRIISRMLDNCNEVISSFNENNPCILVNDLLHPFINTFGFSGKLPYNSLSQKDAFDTLFTVFREFAVKHGVSFDDLGYCTNRKRSKISFENLLNGIDNLKYCETHQTWHFDYTNCPVCEKLYLKQDTLPFKRSKLVFENNISRFYYFDDDYMDFIFCRQKKCYSKQLVKQIELGLTHDLYNSFVGVVPSKLLLCQEKNYGIVFSDFEFKGIINIYDLKSTQRLKFILMLYSTLLPKILDGSFVYGNPDIFENMFMHNSYKGRPIIPNIYLLESEVIISDDKALKDSKKDETLSAFSSFLLQYIMDDEFIKTKIDSSIPEYVEVVNSIKEKKFDQDIIKKALNLHKNYCAIHNAPFSDEERVCMHCKASGINPENIERLSHTHFSGLPKPLYDGGEANIHLYNHQEVQKIFKEGTDLKFKADIIGKVLQKRKSFEEFNENHSDIQFVTIKKVLYSEKNGTYTLKGYTQDNIKGSFKISCLKDREFVSRLGYTTKDIVQILINVCIGIEFIHQNNGFIGDLNGGNILIKDKVVYFIDFDGMSFDDVKNCVYTNTYIYPPSAENNNITKDDDWYSFAVQAFYYLTYSHPFRGACENPNMPNNDVERMKHGYSVLGNHGIKLPNVSIGWNHLSKELLDFFIATFEDKKRESMLKVLKTYLNSVPNAKLTFSKITRKHPALLTLTENTYISKNNALLHKEVSLLNISGGLKFYISKDMIWFSTNGYTFVLNDSTGKLYKFNKTYSEILDVQDNNIFYTTDSGYSISLDKLEQDGNISTFLVKTRASNKILSLRATAENKIIFVEKADNKLNIHGNMDVLCSIEHSSHDNTIHYDEISGNWLVLIKGQSSTTGIVIEDANKHFSFELPETLPANVKFYGNTIYYPINGKICYYNINTQRKNYIPCDIADTSCIIHRKQNKFVICKQDCSYIYTKS